MTDRIKYVQNTKDSAQPVYEVNYTTQVWRVIDYRRRNYGDDFFSGKLRSVHAFTGPMFVEVAKPTLQPGRRYAA